MKYQEKIDLIEEGFNWIVEGKEWRAFQEELLRRGFYQYDIDRIFPGVKKRLSERYGEEFEALLFEEKLEAARSDYAHLSDEMFELIKDRQIEAIKKKSKAKVDELMQAGVEEESIIAEVSNLYFDDEAVNDYLDYYIKHNVKVSGAEKNNYLTTGIGSILLGLGLTFFSMQYPMGKGSYFFYGLIIFGCINLFKAYSTKAAIENL